MLHRKHLSSRTFVLNRPKALNALNLSMVRNMTPQLQVCIRIMCVYDPHAKGMQIITLRGMGLLVY